MNLNSVLKYRSLLLLFVFLTISCGDDKKKEVTQEEPQVEKVVNVPNFNPDSAYHFIKTQVDMGPRVPNTAAHKEAGDYFIATLQSYGAEVQTQEFEATTFDNEKLYLRNIIASFNPGKKKRVLLAAHYDTRPFADKDKERPNEPIAGANDGASGVGVLLEVARVISTNRPPDIGIDIIFFDGEDWGETEGSTRTAPANGTDSWWCLGSQYWSKNKHKKGYSAYYGILLDMVGAKGAQFPMEDTSLYYARSIVEKVWDRAAKLGFSSYFVRKQPGGITDDHSFVNKYANIPMIDIVHYDPATGYFGDFHHSHKDDMDIISKETLEAVGQTLLAVLYYE
ncbi:Aminopeptidase Y (Arg, Lys, Leu preference) [Fulvivirga imtechensis AK7]|uniref:Aminopeptidase Y (Arg, Lys, Leu preference) n=1 Tax=Fulvivirga imtechensis AK7 TaxID=1237149 RepID=L8JVK8_9BACT|nr:M28 family peptidase [Fulvivirga imtechensis]ELR72223.1 Aminopeptidase Y (Arg, Lys, Leu preference) [Fulvivirga imtechensis AK7]